MTQRTWYGQAGTHQIRRKREWQKNRDAGSTVAVISAPFQSVTGVVGKNRNPTYVRLHDVVGLRYEWKDATTRGHNHRWGKSFRPVYALYMMAATVSVPG